MEKLPVFQVRLSLPLTRKHLRVTRFLYSDRISLMWWSKNNFQPQGKTAVIIGASQGVGVELSKKLYAQGCSVILVARTESKLQEKVKSISGKINDFANGVTDDNGEGHFAAYIVSDVSEYRQCEKLWRTIYDQGIDPDYLFCCAGSLIPKLFRDLTPEDLDFGINTNYRTATNSVHSYHAVAKECNQKPRHIVLFSLVLGFFPFIGYGQYAPMKQAISALLIILRQELSPFGYRVLCVFAGNFQLEGFEEEQKTKPEITKIVEGALDAIPGDVCAAKIIDQLAKGYDTITTDFIGWVLGCTVLGVFLPRQWYFFQVIMSFILLLAAPIVNNDITKKINDYFKKNPHDDLSKKEA